MHTPRSSVAHEPGTNNLEPQQKGTLLLPAKAVSGCTGLQYAIHSHTVCGGIPRLHSARCNHHACRVSKKARMSVSSP
jgi:hypothetical protein